MNLPVCVSGFYVAFSEQLCYYMIGGDYMDNTAQRIQRALNLRGMKQSDLVEKTGIGKSSISTYISGSYEPKQKNLYKIAKALDVNEAWLLGFDVPMEREPMEQQWRKEANQFESHINAFYYQMQSLGWTYEWLDNENLYRFSNGTAFFKISSEKYSDFIESSQQYCKEQLEKLYDEYHEQTKVLLFAKNSPNYANAAHPIDGASEEDKQHDEDIMDAEDF